jgi:hypothetical protein
MSEAVIFVAALLTVAVVILAALYLIVRDAPPRQSYRRHRPVK